MRIAMVCLLLGIAASAQAGLSSAQQACVAAMNADGAAVARQQGKEQISCLRDAHAGTLVGPAQACLGADARGLVASRKSKANSDHLKLCTAPLPAFGYSDLNTVNQASQQSEYAIVEDVFGADLDVAVADCSVNKERCACQKKLLVVVEKISDARRKAFTKCKKQALVTADAADDIGRCITDAATAGSIQAESVASGKVGKLVAKLGTTIARCDEKAATPGAFPGNCSALGGTALEGCIDARIACRVCRSLNAIDGLDANCDSFDDGLVNASCVDPTTSTTTTLAPTTTAEPTTTTIETPTTSTLEPTTTTVEPTTTTTQVPMVALTIEFPGGGLGRVQDIANGIDCNDTCTTMIASGTEVNLSVTTITEPEASFHSWRGPCTGAASPCTIAVATDTSVDAVFLAGRVLLGLNDGSAQDGTHPEGEYQHSVENILRLRSIYAGKTVEGIQFYTWEWSPLSMRIPPCVSDLPVPRIAFRAQCWDPFETTYVVSIVLWHVVDGTPVWIAQNSLTVLMSGTSYPLELVSIPDCSAL